MIYFLLPAYNEEQSIGLQLKEIKEVTTDLQLKYQTVIIDDGSTDSTSRKLQKWSTRIPLEVITHEKNQGAGKAFAHGFDKICETASNDDIIITLDADRTQPIKLVHQMIHEIQKGYDVVISSTLATGGTMIGVPWLRRILSRGCNLIYRTFFPIKGVREYTGFYRAYSVSALRMTRKKWGNRMIESDGFVAMAELLLKFRRLPLVMTEVPTILRYDFKSGASKMRIVKTIKDHLNIMVRHMFTDRKRIL
ncbi:glycosyltransferase family 2 protein [Planctomycetota bacterium]